MRARGMGARVIVCEVNAVKALEAVMDGFQVLPMVEAAPLGDIFVTATGMAGVIRSEHFLTMKDGTILANSGHFDVEVDVAALRQLSVSESEVREHLAEFQLPNGKVLHLLAQGRLVGQVAAEASPAAVMDLSFADQALSARYLFQAGQSPPPGVYDVTRTVIDQAAGLRVCHTTLTIQDGVGLRCPSNLVVNCTNSSGAVVSYQVTFCQSNGMVSCSPPSGSTFPPGTNTVNCIATGPGVVLGSCSFNIAVICSKIDFVRSTNGATLTWEGASSLQKATNIVGTWVTVPTTNNSFTISLTEKQAFFRLKQ